MTQFLLLQAPLPFAARHPGLSFSDAAQIGYPITDAASTLFTQVLAPIWKVAPHGEEADAMADQARDVLLQGGELKNTELGQLLQEAIDEKHSFCLFWANDFSDLPEPQTREGLFALLERQLRTDGSSSYELYARWLSDA